MAVQKMLVPEVASWFQNDLASFLQNISVPGSDKDVMAVHLQNISVPGSDPKKWHDPTHTLDHVWIPATDEERLLFSQAFINPNPLIPGGVAPPTSPSNTTTSSNTTSGQGAGSWSPTSGWVTNGAASPQTSSVAVSVSVPINTPASVPAPAATTTAAVPDTVMQPNTSTANDALVVGALADGDNDASKVSGALTDQELDDYYRERRDYYRRRSIIAGAIIGGILLLTVVGLLLYSKPWRRRRTLAQNGRQQIYRPVNPDAGVSRPSFGDGGMQHPSAPAYDHVPLLNREDNNTPAPHYAPPPGPPPPSYGFAPPSLPPPGSSSVAAPPRIPSPEIESTKEENEYRQSVDEKRPLRDGES
ncbi:hypothetical protein BT69DRAFT_55006 [Atractiella rhizophila]|nr:hypothetical protein BT69DRAFT_55006 [Atractiella rhizophila]